MLLLETILRHFCNTLLSEILAVLGWRRQGSYKCRLESSLCGKRICIKDTSCPMSIVIQVVTTNSPLKTLVATASDKAALALRTALQQIRSCKELLPAICDYMHLGQRKMTNIQSEEPPSPPHPKTYACCSISLRSPRNDGCPAGRYRLAAYSSRQHSETTNTRYHTEQYLAILHADHVSWCSRAQFCQ